MTTNGTSDFPTPPITANDGISHGFSQVWADELTIGAGFGVFALRAAARDMGACWTVQECFDRALDADASAALDAIGQFARTLGQAGRRRVVLAMPGCVRVTADELSFLAALQAAQNQHPNVAEAYLCWLFAGRPTPAARQALADFADVITAHGLWVDGPFGPQNAVPSRPSAPVAATDSNAPSPSRIAQG